MGLMANVRRREHEIERRDDEKKQRAAALLRAEAEQLKTAADVWRALDLSAEELPPDVRRTLDEQDAEIFRGSKQGAFDRAETRWLELMDQASSLDWNARCRKAVHDQPKDLGYYLVAAVAIAFLAITFYWPISLAVYAACLALGIEWAPPGF